MNNTDPDQPDLRGPTDEDDEPYLDEPVDEEDEPGEDGGGDGDTEAERSDQDKWRRFGWAALIILTIGVAWGLTLSTILINRSGDRTAELISLFEQGQQQRGAIPGDLTQNQKGRQAAVQVQRQQAQLYRAQQSSERANAFQSNTQARENITQTALADARARQANNEALLASAQAQRAQNPTGSIGARGSHRSGQIEVALLEAINDLQREIKKLRRKL